uniref:Uncharacterized protein n=1 Tax=Anguilla anguilla TaxID=7936 RepID=A0A0E9QRP4_ANGAN
MHVYVASSDASLLLTLPSVPHVQQILHLLQCYTGQKRIGSKVDIPV